MYNTGMSDMPSNRLKVDPRVQRTNIAHSVLLLALQEIAERYQLTVTEQLFILNSVEQDMLRALVNQEHKRTP